MKPQHFVALLAAALLSLVVAVTAYVSTQPWTATGSGSAEAMLPALKSSGDKVVAIEIDQGGKIIKVAEKDDKWVVASQEDYPANVEAVRGLLLAASEASLVERKTAKKDMLKLLGLGDPKVNGAPSRLIRFLDAKDNPVAEIIVGNKKNDAFGASKSGTYVRKPGEDQSWLANRSIDGSATLSDWVKTRVVDQPTDSIKTTSIEVAGQPAYTIERDTDGKSHKLSQMPVGKKLKYVNSVDEIIESASYVDFKGVRKAGKSDALPSIGKVTFETDKGLKVELDLRSDGKQAWVRISASGEGAGKKDAEAMSALVDGWEFEIPVAKVSTVMKKQADLLDDAAS
jgi:hypothetical protein